jgi:hypothetical protein
MKLTFKRLFSLCGLTTSTGLVSKSLPFLRGVHLLPNLFLVVIVVGLVVLFAFTNRFHDAASVVAIIIMIRAISLRKALDCSSL